MKERKDTHGDDLRRCRSTEEEETDQGQARTYGTPTRRTGVRDREGHLEQEATKKVRGQREEIGQGEEQAVHPHESKPRNLETERRGIDLRKGDQRHRTG